MRDYGRVHTSFWASPTITPLSDDGKLAALYLLTGPHASIIGAYRLPDGYACEDLGWAPERWLAALAETVSEGFANRCETTKWVWIVRYLEWNPPENPNQRKAAMKCAEAIPDACTWKAAFATTYGLITPSTLKPLRNGSGTVAKPFRNQEQEQDQEQEQESVPRTREASAPAGAGPRTEPDEERKKLRASPRALWDAYRAAAETTGRQLPLDPSPKDFEHLAVLTRSYTLDQLRPALTCWWASPHVERRYLGTFRADVGDVLAHLSTQTDRPFRAPTPKPSPYAIGAGATELIARLAARGAPK